MKAEDSFTLHWCPKHSNWYQYNCPDCMVESNEEDIKKAGMKEVVEWLKTRDWINLYANYYTIGFHIKEWQAKLKDWHISA